MTDLREDIKTVRFIYHAPSEKQMKAYVDLRIRAKGLALMIDDHAPDSREKSLAITKLEEVIMWANAAIARRSTKDTKNE